MGDDGKNVAETPRDWRRRGVVAVCVLLALLLIFHRPLLLTIARQIALHYAAKDNLRADFQLEGSLFSNLIVRNLHLVATGPSAIESIDLDLLRLDYNLPGLFRLGMSQFLRSIDVHAARVVVNPPSAPKEISRRKPAHTKPELPSIFPERLRISDATLVVRDSPKDLIIEHLDLDLNPRQPGQLQIAKLQLSGGQSWSKIVAQTSYTNRNLIIRDLALTDQESIRLLSIDASRIEAKQLAINLEAAIGGGAVSSVITLNETRSALNADFRFTGNEVAADCVNKYLGLPEAFVTGNIEHFAVDLTGDLGVPRTWNGVISARLNDFAEGGMKFDHGALGVVARNGTLTIESADLVHGKDEFHLHGSAELPNELSGFGRSPTILEIAAKLPDLSLLGPVSHEQLSGSAELNGRIDITNARLEADLEVNGDSVGFSEGTIGKVRAKIRGSKIMTPDAAGTAAATAPRRGTLSRATEKRPWFADLKANIRLDADKIRFRDYVIDSLGGALITERNTLRIEQLDIDRKENKLAITGRYNLPGDLREIGSQPGQLNVSLAATELGDYWAVESADKINGPLQLTGQLEWKGRQANGQLSVFGAGLKMRDLIFKQLSAQCTVANNVVYLNDLTASLNEQDFVAANGLLDLRRPYHYAGKLSTRIADLSALKPLLRTSGNKEELGGALAIDWDGTGDGIKFNNSGNLKVALDHGRYGDLQSLQASVDASYSPDGLNVPTIFLRSNKMDFQAIVQAKGDVLELTKIQLDQGEAKYASGYVSFPFVWRNIGTSAPLIPSTGKVLANFQSENIDLKKLFEDFGAKPAATGTVNVKMEASGTISDLDARLDLEMRDVRTQKFASLEPATFHLGAESQHDQLTISGKLQQTKIQPLELTANLPFNVPQIIRDKRIAEETPIHGSLRLPRSSVNFVRQLIPTVQQLDGDAALDVDLGGTIGRPVFKGRADMTLNVARTTDPTVPALQNFKARLVFADDALNFEQFAGELSGGHFNLSGRVTFPKLTAANVDLKLKAESALVARNDTLTIRSNADIQFRGPINAVAVTGNVSLTNSQFLKNLDLIPIGLPGRPAPQPPASHPQLSFPDPPLRDWKFDVAIKTRDPVLIRGNLATGGAVADLHFVGTGLRPGLQGLVRLQNVEATLPFSRLEIAYGFLYFDPADSLNPKIDLHGTSVIRDYTIHVYIYGTSLAPEAVFNSEPPLPQEEIISLLATGTTREELAGNNNVLAGRAAMLLVQQLYRKVFKKGQATQSNSVFNRLDIDVGTVDPRTGQQQASARFKINDQFVVVGDLGIGGGYRGMLKYLIRFD